MIPNDSPDVPAPPPGLSRENLEAVRIAREVCHRYTNRYALSEVGPLHDLLAAYEALSVRMAWLAAQYAEMAAEYERPL